MISDPKATTDSFTIWPLITQVKYDLAYNLLCSVGFLASLDGVRLEQAACANLFSAAYILSNKPSDSIVQVRRLVQGGLYWIAPPCNTWVWLSRSTTGRSRTRVRGKFSLPFEFQSCQTCYYNDTNSKRVAFCMRQEGLQEKQKSKPTCSPNALPAARLQACVGKIVHTDRCCCPRCRLLRCEYCFRRGSYYAIENPTSSLLWCYEPLEVHLG